MSLNQLTIKEAREGLKKKDFSCQELVQSCLTEIKKRDKKINAFITLNENALKEAKEVDKKIARGQKMKKIEGIPLAIKDNILVEGITCTAGSKILENYQAVYDATVIRKLKEAGALFLGKTNLDEFAMGSSGENSAFGCTRNPYDLDRVPGGSSSGSAAALAANFCLASLGSDTGGSIRQPAAFCGLVGLKPTYGRVSRFGLIAMASSFDQIGPIAKTVEDCQLLFDIIKGKDELDSTSVESKISNFQFPISNLRIGLPKEYFSKGLDEEIKNKIKKLVKKLEANGAVIQEVSLPYTEYALACYYIIMPAEVSTNLARYDGIRFGKSEIRNPEKGRGPLGTLRPKSEIKNLIDLYLENRTRGFGEEVRKRIILGTYVLSSGYYGAYYCQAQKVRTLIKNDFVQVFISKNKVDCLITPTTPKPAFKINEKRESLEMYLSDIFTASANLAGLPALSVPIGLTKNGLPIGLQIIGDYFQEDKILEIGKIVELFK